MTFEQAGSRYLILKEQLDNGAITYQEFDRYLDELSVETPDGKEWRINASTGTWVERSAVQDKETPWHTTSKSPETLVELFATLAKGLVKSIPKIILIGLLMSVVTWLAHTYLVARVNDGLMYRPDLVAVNSIVRLQETRFAGVNAFWGLMSYFLIGFVMRIRSMGVNNWLNTIKLTPQNVMNSVNKNIEKGPSRLLLGVAIALVISLLYRNLMFSWVLALGLLLVTTAHFQSLEVTVLKVSLSDLQRLLQRKLLIEGEENDVVYLVLVGMSAGFALAGIMRANIYLLLVICLLCLGVFVFFKNKEVQKIALSIVLTGGTMVFLEQAVQAYCEGASYSQAGSWPDWWGSDNADVVRRNGLLPAGSSFLGGALGASTAAAAPGAIGAEAALISEGGAAAPSKQEDGTTYDFGDGQKYREGGAYTFDDGVEYEVVDGDFVPARELRDGERYTNPAGDEKIWVGGQPWQESDWLRQQETNASYEEAFNADNEAYWEQRRQEAAEDLRRQEIRRQQAAMEAERLEKLAESIKSGRHSLSDSENASEFVEGLEEASKKLRETDEIDEFDRRIIDRNFERLRSEMDQIQDKALEESDRAQRSARNWDIATRGAEVVENVANESIDKLAIVTGPPGRKIQAIYHGTRGAAGGLSEGYVTGEYGRSMLEHTSAAAGDLMEARLEGRSEDAFKIGRGAVEGGYEAYKDGESIRDGVFEGAADSTSDVVKDKMPSGYKEGYSVAENAVREGYRSSKDGGSFLDGAMDGVVEGSKDVLIEKGVDYAGDMIAPISDVGAEEGIEFVSNNVNKETRKLIKESFKS